jgi:thiamine pyrophosphate-dependent acetolactate synthase large subunit-like protein
VKSGARPELDALGDQIGALHATSLLGKGLFNGNSWALDLAGAFASDFGREKFAEADLVIAFGAGLGHYTTEGGYLYSNARVVQVDINPRGLWQGLKTADLHVRSDAKAAATAILNRLQQKNVKRAGWRSDAALKQQIASDVPDSKQFPVQPGTVDPRRAIEELDRTIPKDWDIVVGGGHYFSIALTHIKNRAPEKVHVFVDFGAIGSGLPAAIGVAKARGDGKVALIEGDGSIMMHVQELETVRRQGIQMLVAIINDGGYGAEFHKFRANKVDPTGAIHGRGDIAAVATGFGLRGANVNALGKMEGLFREHRSANIATLWDVHTDDLIPSRSYRRVHFGEA